MSKKSQAAFQGSDTVIVGGGDHGRVILSVLTRQGARVIGYTATAEGDGMGSPFLGTDAYLDDEALVGQFRLAIGVGIPSPNPERLSLMHHLLDLGWNFPPVISANAHVADDVDLQAGSVVFDGAVVATSSQLGIGSIVNHQASVDHDCRIGNNVHVAPGATICGSVSVGESSMIGAGATVIPGVQIGRDCMIAAGAVVTANTEPVSLYAGMPARRIR